MTKMKMAISPLRKKPSNIEQFLSICKMIGCYFSLGVSYITLTYLSAPVQRYFYLSNLERTWLPFVFFVFSGIMSPLFGHISDVYGRVKLLKLMFCMITFVALCATVAPSYTWFVFLFGLCGAFRPISPVMMSLAHELTTAENKHWTTLLPASGAISSSLAGFIPLLIDPNKDWRFAFFVLMCLPNLVGVVMLFSLEEPSQPCQLTSKGSEKPSKIEISKTMEDFPDVTFSQSLRIIYHDFCLELILIIILGILVGIMSGPVYNLASEFSHYVETECIKDSDSKVVTLKCSDIKLLSSSDIIVAMLPPLTSGLFLILLSFLNKYISLGNLLRASTILQILVTTLLYLNACSDERIRVLIICAVAGMCTVMYGSLQLFTCEILPRSCRGLGSSVMIFFLRFGDYAGYVLIESTMYEHFKAVLISLIVICIIQTVLSFCLRKSRNKDLD